MAEDDPEQPREVDRPGLQRIPIPFTQSLLQGVDDYRFAARMPSRAEAIRTLIQLGLQSYREGWFKIAPISPRPGEEKP